MLPPAPLREPPPWLHPQEEGQDTTKKGKLLEKRFVVARGNEMEDAAPDRRRSEGEDGGGREDRGADDGVAGHVRSLEVKHCARRIFVSICCPADQYLLARFLPDRAQPRAAGREGKDARKPMSHPR